MCLQSAFRTSMQKSFARERLLSYTGVGILTNFPFTELQMNSNMLHSKLTQTCMCVYVCESKLHNIVCVIQSVKLKSVSDIGLGLTHPRRNKLQHGTFLRFGHPRLLK